LLIPEIAFLPDGYIEPSGEIVLSFATVEKQFIYRWTDEAQMSAPLSLEAVTP